jgi:hypothetical protein
MLNFFVMNQSLNSVHLFGLVRQAHQPKEKNFALHLTLLKRCILKSGFLHAILSLLIKHPEKKVELKKYNSLSW